MCFLLVAQSGLIIPSLSNKECQTDSALRTAMNRPLSKPQNFILKEIKSKEISPPLVRVACRVRRSLVRSLEQQEIRRNDNSFYSFERSRIFMIITTVEHLALIAYPMFTRLRTLKHSRK